MIDALKEVKLLSSLGDNIRNIRNEQNISAEELSRRSRINMRTIYQIENSEQENPRLTTIQKIADGLGVTLIALFSNSESKSGTKHKRKVT